MRLKSMLTGVIVLQLSVAIVFAGNSLPGSQDPAFEILHVQTQQGQSDASLVYHALYQRLNGRGPKLTLNAGGLQNLNINQRVNVLRNSPHHGGLFFYFRGTAVTGADGEDFFLTLSPEAQQNTTCSFRQMMRGLRSATAQSAIWVLLDLEAGPDGFERIEHCLRSEGIEAQQASDKSPPTQIVIGLRTPQQEKQLQHSDERFAHWIARGLEGCAGPATGPSINVPAPITQQGLSKYLSAQLAESEVRLLLSPSHRTGDKSDSAMGEVAQRPRTPDELATDHAERIADDLGNRMLRFVIVTGVQAGDLPGVSRTGFTAALTRQLELSLQRKSRQRFTVINHQDSTRAISNWLNSRNLAPQHWDPTSPEALQHVATVLGRDPGQLAIVSSRLISPGQFEHSAEFSLQVRIHSLQDTSPENPVIGRGVSTGGQALQSSMQSFVPVPPTQPPVAEKNPIPVAPPEFRSRRLSDPAYLSELQLQIEQQKALSASQKHPLLNKSLGLRVGVRRLQSENQWTQLPLKFSADEKTVSVQLRQGDIYAINVQNDRASNLFLRLFVDGLNTLPEPERDDAGNLLDGQGLTPWKSATPVVPELASYWYLKPGSSSLVEGFYEDLRFSHNVPLHRFRVVSASDSIAANLGLMAETGVITALFYRPVSLSDLPEQSFAAAGTARGPRISRQLDSYPGKDIPGALAAAVQIQYHLAVD